MTTLRGALLGFGFIAENGHVPAYKSHASSHVSPALDIVAVADLCPTRRALASLVFPHARLYDDPHALLREESQHIHFVDICTPPYAHAHLAHAALESRLHVLCEKPLALRTSDAVGLLQHAKRVGRILMPCHNYLNAPVTVAVRRLLDEGTIGSVHLVTLDTFRNTHARGVPDWKEHWRRDRQWSGGGIAMDHGSHTFYLAFDWLGGYPTSVCAAARHFSPFESEDTFSCQLTFPSGVAMARLLWSAGMRRAIYTLHGSRGAIRVEDDAVQVSTMTPQPPSSTSNMGAVGWTVREELAPSRWNDPGHGSWFVPLLQRFGRAMAANSPSPTDAIAACHCIQVIEAAYESCRQGSREIPIPPLALTPLEGPDPW